jgi:hypothetical protein
MDAVEAREILMHLVDSGVAEAEGKGRGGKYLQRKQRQKS